MAIKRAKRDPNGIEIAFFPKIAKFFENSPIASGDWAPPPPPPEHRSRVARISQRGGFFGSLIQLCINLTQFFISLELDGGGFSVKIR